MTKTKNDCLSWAASALHRLAISCALAEEIESELPEYGHPRGQDIAEHIARANGFKHIDALLLEIEKRTSARWIHFSGLQRFASMDDYMADPVHGRTQNA